jgi:hypothetical protein
MEWMIVWILGDVNGNKSPNMPISLHNFFEHRRWCLVSDMKLLAMAIGVVFVCCGYSKNNYLTLIMCHVFIVVLGVIFCTTQILD